MVGLCTMYFFHIRGTGDDKKVTTTKSQVKIEDKLTHNEELLKEDYPETAREVMAIHNELLGLLCSSDMKEEYIEQYVDTIRLLYSEALLELNPVNEQKSLLFIQREAAKDDPVIIISSEIKEVIRLKEAEEVSEELVDIEVVHYTTNQDITIIYHLVNEAGKWKINSWDNE